MVEQLSDEQIEEFREVFNLYDKNNDGLVKKEDVGSIFKSLGQNPSKEDIDRLTSQVMKKKPVLFEELR